MTTTDHQTQIDALLAAEVHTAERALNLAIQKAANEGLDVNVEHVDTSVMGKGRCETVHVAVRRRL